MNLCKPVPLVGTWLFRRDLKKTGENAIGGDAGAVRTLCTIVCDDPDPVAKEIARTALRELHPGPATETFCEEVLSRDTGDLAPLAIACGATPIDLPARALFLFATGQYQHYTALDVQSHRPLLARGYAAAGETARARCRETARRAGRHPDLSRAILAACPGNAGPCLSDEEWEIVITGLILNEQWDDLWYYVFFAPLSQAIAGIRALGSSGWTPPDGEKTIWEELEKSLLPSWEYPRPHDEPVLSIPADEGKTLRLGFSPDGSLFATSTSQGLLHVWQTGSGSLINSFLASGAVTGFAITPDNRHFLHLAGDGTICCRNLESGFAEWDYHSEGGIPSAFAISPDGSFILVGEGSGSISTISVRDGQHRSLAPAQSSPVAFFAISPDSQAIAVSYENGSLSAGSVESPSGFRCIRKPGDEIREITWDPAGKEILVIAGRYEPALFDAQTGDRKQSFTGISGNVMCSATAPGGSYFAAACDDGIVRIWCRDRGVPVRTVPLYNRHITCAEFTHDAKQLIAGFDGGTIRVIAVGEKAQDLEWKAHTRAVSSLAVSPDGMDPSNSGIFRCVNLSGHLPGRRVK